MLVILIAGPVDGQLMGSPMSAHTGAGEPLGVYEAGLAGAARFVPLLEHVGAFASRGPGCLTGDRLGGV